MPRESAIDMVLPAIVRRSRGLALILLGFATIYVLMFFNRTSDRVGLAVYLGGGFAALVTLAGVVITFLELRSDAPAELISMSSERSDLEHTIRQLGRNYDLLRRQTTQGFILAGTFMALGICVILVGSVGELFGFTKEGANLTTVAGVVVEAISGLGLYLFNQTFKQLNAISDRLHETWRVLAAFAKADGLPEDKKSEVVATLITKLVEPPGRSQG
jgi:hypothetical protein